MSDLLRDILAEAVRRGASDVHLMTDLPPMLRIDGRIEQSARPPLTERALTPMLDGMLNDLQRSEWLTSKRVCFTWSPDFVGSFRVSLYSHLGRMEASIRVGRAQAPTLEELGVPERLAEMALAPYGLVLVTGPTGVGKTSTLNAVLGRVNAQERKKIIAIEDPVEFTLPRGRSLVVQQELGLDTDGFGPALVHALRQDPDIICVGEMRDLDTIATALTAAETGHLVMATLHTTGAAGTISRIIDVFPAAQQAQVRIQLAHTLRATMSQKLLPRADGQGRVLVYELMIVNDAVRNIIREGRLHQLKNVIQTGAGLGMVQLDNMIRDAWLAGEITYEVAVGAIGDPAVLQASSTPRE